MNGALGTLTAVKTRVAEPGIPPVLRPTIQMDTPVPARPLQFELLANLGPVKVPEDYCYRTMIERFRGQYGESFQYFSEAVTDGNFGDHSSILNPGERLWASAYRQVVDGTTSLEERLAFYQKQALPVFAGVHGLLLVYAQKKPLLPAGYWYAAPVEKGRLWTSERLGLCVPRLFIGCDDEDSMTFERLGLGMVSANFNYRDALLLFSDKEPPRI